MPVKTVARLSRSAAAITSLSRTEASGGPESSALPRPAIVQATLRIRTTVRATLVSVVDVSKPSLDEVTMDWLPFDSRGCLNDRYYCGSIHGCSGITGYGN